VSGAPRSALPVALAIGIAIFGVYWLTMPIVLPDSGDAGAQVALAQRSPPELNPHHLLVIPAHRQALQVAARFKERPPAFQSIQILNALAGAAAGALFFALLRGLAVSGWTAAAFTFGLAFTAVHWLHSREAETGILANGFLLLAANLLPAGMAVLLPAAAAALAILSALNAALALPALALLGGISIWRSLKFLVVAAILTALGFFAFHLIHGVTPREAMAHLVTHPSTARLPEQGDLSAANALRAASGMVNAMIGDTPITTAVKQAMRGEERIPIAPRDGLRFGLGALVALSLLIPLVLPPRGGHPHARRVWLATWVALVPIAAFNLLWLGSDPQFWLPVLPFLGALAAVRAVGSRMAGTVAAIAAALLFAANVPRAVPTRLDPKGGVEWQQAAAFARFATPGDLLIHNNGWGRYLDAFGKYEVVNLVYSLPAGRERYEEKLFAAIDRHLGTEGRVFALDVFGPPSSRAIGGWEEIAAISGRGREDWLTTLEARYDARPVGSPAYGDLFEIERRGQPAPTARQIPPASRSRKSP
jgi:hypothetical protein